MATKSTSPGIYNAEYFSGSQVAIYIGDVWVDEITSMSYVVSQARTPIYGYADMLFRDVSKGPVIVQGQFTINFKEAGYLFLILEHYKKLMNPFAAPDLITRQNIERVINMKEVTVAERNKMLEALAQGHQTANAMRNLGHKEYAKTWMDLYTLGAARYSALTGPSAAASLTGYASEPRLGSNTAEGIFEAFENQIWGERKDELADASRRCDAPNLNPFDIYVSFGDYAGDDTANHTIQKLSRVHITGTSKQIVIDGQPISEAYSFLARNLI